MHTQSIHCAVLNNMNNGFLVVWFGHGFINCLASDVLLCPLDKVLIT